MKKRVKDEIELPLRPDDGGTKGRAISLKGKQLPPNSRTNLLSSQRLPTRCETEASLHLSLRCGDRFRANQEGREAGLLP